jgi:hypothetical protein
LCLKLNFTFSPTAFHPLTTCPLFGFIAFAFDPWRWSSCPPFHQNVYQNVIDFPRCNTNSCPCRKSFYILVNPCTSSIIISQHLCSRRNVIYPKFYNWNSITENASDVELRHINCQSSSSMPKARHSLLKELNLASLSELTLKKRKLNERIQNKESVLCKLKKKYKAMIHQWRIFHLLWL